MHFSSPRLVFPPPYMQAPQRTVADLVAAYSRSDIARRDAAWVEALVAQGALSAADRVMVGDRIVHTRAYIVSSARA
jgi:hypothetical protein